MRRNKNAEETGLREIRWQLTPDDLRLLNIMKQDSNLSVDHETASDYIDGWCKLGGYGLAREHPKLKDHMQLTQLGMLVCENCRPENGTGFVIVVAVFDPDPEPEPDYPHCVVCDGPANREGGLCSFCEGRGR